jgi:hypothetical protein
VEEQLPLEKPMAQVPLGRCSSRRASWIRATRFLYTGMPGKKRSLVLDNQPKKKYTVPDENDIMKRFHVPFS